MDVKIIWNKVLDFFDFKVQEENYQEKELLNEDDEKRIISIYKRQGFKIMVYSPESFTEVQNIVDQLKESKPVIVNLQDIEKEKAKKLVDFISGAVYAIDGTVQKIYDLIFVFAPQNVEIDVQSLRKNKSLLK
ncbi:cell division protein SepF [Natronospora cellulosivora (SeqCode)]